MKEKEMSKLSAKAIEEVQKIRHGFQMGSRVGVTQLGRSTQWREDLDRLSAMEVVDRNETKAILLKPEVYEAMVTYMEVLEKTQAELEAELETAEVEALYGHRLHRKESDFVMGGKESAQDAVALFLSNPEKFKAPLDGDK
ncbi:hypothetical protein [Bacillus sp. Au-Bac7]|uniref:hypothetical protein n=1 Tax=Bacillus sp. Au-Bac7 TaxID=2906458 RepID=UPI001E4359EB|nr:hypothetical protein [Bacillus sp. Au-Bac7]MCE4052084.1 hypothetical protein [Bacillus sp. Au-Bac7]